MGEVILRIKDLRKRFDTNQVLNGINLEVNRGEIIGYIGQNGAGKSTTVKIMLGLIEEFSGDVEIFGKSIRDGDIKYKEKIGYVPESAELYDSLTGIEYLCFIGQLYGLDEDAAERKGRELLYLLGIDKQADERITSYSKGMKQKVLISAALINDPEILFLDEPLNGIDANTVMIIKEVMAKLAKEGKTIFYSSHIMDVVEKISSRIVLINKGEIVADGSFESLQNKFTDESLEEIFNSITGFENYDEVADQIVATMKSNS